MRCLGSSCGILEGEGGLSSLFLVGGAGVLTMVGLLFLGHLGLLLVLDVLLRGYWLFFVQFAASSFPLLCLWAFVCASMLGVGYRGVPLCRWGGVVLG